MKLQSAFLVLSALFCLPVNIVAQAADDNTDACNAAVVASTEACIKENECASKCGHILAANFFDGSTERPKLEDSKLEDFASMDEFIEEHIDFFLEEYKAFDAQACEQVSCCSECSETMLTSFGCLRAEFNPSAILENEPLLKFVEAGLINDADGSGNATYSLSDYLWTTEEDFCDASAGVFSCSEEAAAMATCMATQECQEACANVEMPAIDSTPDSPPNYTPEKYAEYIQTVVEFSKDRCDKMRTRSCSGSKCCPACAEEIRANFVCTRAERNSGLEDNLRGLVARAYTYFTDGKFVGSDGTTTVLEDFQCDAAEDMCNVGSGDEKSPSGAAATLPTKATISAGLAIVFLGM